MSKEKKKRISEIIFKGAKLQVGGRVKIPKAVLDTLNWNEGKKLVIKLNVEDGKILIEAEHNNKK